MHDSPIIPVVEKKTSNDILFPSSINSDHNYTVGEEDTFTVWFFEIEEYKPVLATCEFVSDEAYLFLENSLVVDWNFTEIGNLVDNNMIPIINTNFGEPSDIDNNDRFVILFAVIPGVGGYFSPNDISGVGYGGEIVYINAEGGTLPPSRIDTIIHELQHLTHYSYDPYEFRWFDEGCSMFSEFYLGYSLGRTENYDLYYPNQISLLYWDYENAKLLTDYQAALTFISYIQDQYGAENLSAIYHAQSDGTKLQGKAAIMEILNQYQPNLTFEQLYLNWIVASTVDVYYSGDNRAFYYKNFDCRPDSIKFPQSFTSESYPFSKTFNIDPWATKIYTFREYPNPNEINISIEIPSDSQNHLFGINIIKVMKENNSINYGINSFMLTADNVSEGYQATLNATEDSFDRFYLTISHLDGGEGFYWDIPASEKNVRVSLEIICDSMSESEQKTTTNKQVTATIPYLFILFAGFGLKLLKNPSNRRKES